MKKWAKYILSFRLRHIEVRHEFIIIVHFSDSNLPRMTERPVAKDLSPTTLKLLWKPARVDNDSPVTYIVELCKPPSNKWVVIATNVRDTNLLLSDVDVDKEYTFRVIAQNEFGKSEPSPPCTHRRERSKYILQKIDSIIIFFGFFSMFNFGKNFKFLFLIEKMLNRNREISLNN